MTFRVALGVLSGCIEPPAVPTPGGDAGVDGGGRVFADVVIAYELGGQVTTCVDTLPSCGAPSGRCTSNPAIGANDGRTFDLGMGGRIELGFRCETAREHGGQDSPDFKVWSTVVGPTTSPDFGAVVEVGWDGASYQIVGVLTEPDQSFDLARVPIDAIRFVRIADRGLGGIAIDAVEAL